MAYGYSSDSTLQELSNEYQHDRVRMFFKNLFVLVFQMKVDIAFEELMIVRVDVCMKNRSE